MTGVIQRLWVRVPPESHFAGGERLPMLHRDGEIRGRPRALPPRGVRPFSRERGGAGSVLGAGQGRPGHRRNPGPTGQCTPASAPAFQELTVTASQHGPAVRAWWSCHLPTANISSPKKAFSCGWCLPSPHHPLLPLPPSFRRLLKRRLQEQEPQRVLLDPAEQMPFKIT